MVLILVDLARLEQESGLICPSSALISRQGRRHLKKSDLGRLFLVSLAFVGSSSPLPTHYPILLYIIASLFLHFKSNLENINTE